MLGNATNLVLKSVLATCVAFSGVTPLYAGIDPASSLQIRPTDPLLEMEMLLAQTVDHPDRSNNRTQGEKDLREGDVRLNRVTTRKIVEDINSIRIECSKYDEAYRIDCLRQGIAMIAASIPDRGEYSEARKILRRASAKLDRIVAKYGDPAAPRVVAQPGVNPRFKKRRTYKAIKREVLKQAVAEATAAVSEASTQLLRSSENSERRSAHYQDISVAVDSTKTLLRSS